MLIYSDAAGTANKIEGNSEGTMTRNYLTVVCGLLLTSCLLIDSVGSSAQSSTPYNDVSLPFEERVDDLVSRMTLEEKVSQMMNAASAIPRLDIPAYDWWNEGLHGVARAGVATVFPQAIGLAATWDTSLMHRVADVISTEARAKYHEAVRNNDRARYKGLTFWSPNINIFRDPRWGRGQETYGEDPYLTSRMGVEFVRGLQGDDPKYFKVISTPKHYAVHSGPEPERHGFNAVTDQRDLFETYLPAFEACVKEAGAYSVMCAYNRYLGEPCCAQNTLLRRILRDEWKFPGYVVSDCGAVYDIYKFHKAAEDAASASAMSVKAGTDLECGNDYRSLLDAVKKGLVTEAELDVSLKRLFAARFKLGMFDPPDAVPYSSISISENDSTEHRRLSLEAARESIVLLKNQNRLLPLKKTLKKIAVIGPTADDLDVLLGNYAGTPSSYVTPLKGIQAKLSTQAEVVYEQGCSLVERIQPAPLDSDKRAIKLASESDVVVFIGGISPKLEGEELKLSVDGFRGGDRTSLDLPRQQESLLKAVSATGTPVVLVLTSGSALSVNWANEHVQAIVQLWYSGEEGGTALADVLFGDYNPGGRLPVTIYKSVAQLPRFEDYGMAGRTYRYFEGEPLYPFGYGLSYTTFAYSKLELPKRAGVGETVVVRARVTNTGKVEGDEVAQLYVKDLASSVPAPIRSLQGFRRVHLKPGQSEAVSFTLTPRHFSLIDKLARRIVEPGDFELSMGGRQPGRPADNSQVVTAKLALTGNIFLIK
ncbi:MAG TPA: glycoside hydrolase family 3 C-terminal domain-containing protein [Blastocatellia bacterium]|nr:glycoside hydrolase family 3 C-terminal domain-containing protein [Blastocatellia bacterium]